MTRVLPCNYRQKKKEGGKKVGDDFSLRLISKRLKIKGALTVRQKKDSSECVFVWKLILTRHTQAPLFTHRQLKDLFLFLRVAVSLTARQQFGENPPSSQPQSTQKPKTLPNVCVCVCVFDCSTLCILVDGETDMTLSYFLSGGISSPRPKESWAVSSSAC